MRFQCWNFIVMQRGGLDIFSGKGLGVSRFSRGGAAAFLWFISLDLCNPKYLYKYIKERIEPFSFK